ncbi:MAG: Fur family transcriptional regulator [Christensenellales bacterium]|jgi:Fe2+ or Zn2+ uptake regulation protein
MKQKKVAFVWPEGMKRTKSRERVLHILQQAQGPLSVMEIHARAEKEGQPIWLSTIYRILELFTERGWVEKSSIFGQDMAYYELNRETHQHYAVCVQCYKRIPIEDCPMKEFEHALKDQGFQVAGHKIEVYGYCDGCLEE